MFNFVRFLSLLSLLLVSSFSFAEYFYWLGKDGSKHSTAQAACFTNITTPFKRFDGILPNSTPPTAICTGYPDQIYLDNGWSIESGSTSRLGDSCPPDNTYNPETGECVPPPPQCDSGMTYSNAFPATRFGNFYVPNAPSSACINSCAYDQYSGGGGGCFPTASGTYCVANFMSNGEECGGNTDFPPPPDPDDPDPDDPNDYSNCQRRMQADGSYMWDCNPSANQGDCPDGFLIGNDGSTCYRDPNVPPPKDPGDGDGSGDGDGDGDGDGSGDGSGNHPPDYSKDSTLKSIDGKIGTSNTLLQGIKDAIGNIPGGGGGSNNGDGDGEGDESSVTGGDACDSPPVCTGDAVQCAILNQNYKARCEAEDLNDFEKHKDKIDTLLEGDKFELNDSEVVEVESFVTGQSRWLSSSCPADETMSLRLNGGRTFSLSYQPLCNAASAISPLIVIIATLMATLYVGRAAGG